MTWLAVKRCVDTNEWLEFNMQSRLSSIDKMHQFAQSVCSEVTAVSSLQVSSPEDTHNFYAAADAPGAHVSKHKYISTGVFKDF